MSSERWERIKEVFGTALERDPAARAVFLEKACAGDAEMRREVESLLAAHQASDSFLEHAAVDISASLGPAHAAFADGETVGTYRILRTLGRGGMATVYLARDLRHRRSVALKVLHPELGQALGADRFLREIEVAANLSHPHILPLFDSGEADGLLYYVMPYVEGESLRERLRRETQLPLDDALQIAREVADALGFAHAHGIVHRDVKPENILLSGGHALVADFGIARAIGSLTADGLTEAGMVIGTPAYMSPEQARGDARIDGRTDTYSLGCVLFEMLAGEPPFTGPTVQAILDRALSEIPRSIHAVRAVVPPAVDAVIARALAVTPADRFVTSGEFGTALEAAARQSSAITRQDSALLRRRPLVAVLLIGIAIGGGVLFAGLRRQALNEPPGAKLIAVLPFENLGDPDDEYFADGISDEVRGRLATVAGVQVIARGSSMSYKKTDKTPQQIARELGVDYLLTGTVRWETRAGGQRAVHLSPELVQVGGKSAPHTKWQAPFDASVIDVFQAYAEIASRVTKELGVELSDSTHNRLAQKSTHSPSAYEEYLKAEEIMQGFSAVDPPSLRQALEHYQRAVTLDSGFAQAWAGLSRTHSYLYANATPTPAEDTLAREAASRGLALRPDLPETHVAEGLYMQQVPRDAAHAYDEYQRALKLDPNNSDALSNLVGADKELGQWQAALAHGERARVLDPRSTLAALSAAEPLLWLRRYSDAREAIDHVLTLSPANYLGIEEKAMISLGEGDLPDARKTIANALKTPTVDPNALSAMFAGVWDLFWVLDEREQQLVLHFSPQAYGSDRGAWGLVLAETYWLRGDTKRAESFADSGRAGFQEQLRDVPNDAQRHVLLGLTLAYLGRKQEAITEGQRGVTLLPMSKNPWAGTYIQHQLVRIYMLVGEPEKALDNLEPLLKVPYYLSPGWLKIDPTFTPLRGNPRFERLVNGT